MFINNKNAGDCFGEAWTLLYCAPKSVRMPVPSVRWALHFLWMVLPFPELFTESPGRRMQRNPGDAVKSSSYGRTFTSSKRETGRPAQFNDRCRSKKLCLQLLKVMFLWSLKRYECRPGSASAASRLLVDTWIIGFRPKVVWSVSGVMIGWARYRKRYCPEIG
jgi:hypothetical protein